MTLTTTHLKDKPVIIIGGGWSGLACATTLARQGIKVQLLESARHLGGRARSIRFNKFLTSQSSAYQSLDNGQHIMLGAYHFTLKLFKTIGLNETDILERQPLELNIFSPRQKTIRLKSNRLPAPLHLIFALMNMRGLTLSERASAIKMALKLALNHYSLKEDICVSDLLKRHQQSPKLIQALWEPLCLATMNTPIHYASAQVFLNVIRDSFSNHRKDSDLLFFKKNLSQTFCEPALEFITQHGGNINCSSKVISLNISPLTENIETSSPPVYGFTINTTDSSYLTHTVVLATPADISNKLLHSHNNCSFMQSTSFLQPRNATLHFHYEPICTVYMQYPPSIKLPSRMVGFFETIGQWAIDRSLCQQAGVIAIVISGPGKQRQMPHKLLVAIIHKELGVCVPDLPQWLDFRVITVQRATFSCRVNIEQQRPFNETFIPGLFLAGDYTNTHYPATLEGAVKSGINAARQIIDSNSFI